MVNCSFGLVVWDSLRVPLSNKPLADDPGKKNRYHWGNIPSHRQRARRKAQELLPWFSTLEILEML